MRFPGFMGLKASKNSKLYLSDLPEVQEIVTKSGRNVTQDPS